LACFLCTNGGEKDPTPFTKVVEQCKIYNFGIQRFAYFSSKILRKTLLNKATPNCLAPERVERGHTRRRARPCRLHSRTPSYAHAKVGRRLLVRPRRRGAPVRGSVGPGSAPRVALACVGRPRRLWSSPLAPPLPHAATHCATTLVIPSPRHTAYKNPAGLLLARPESAAARH
jgi:hypothetical protein